MYHLDELLLQHDEPQLASEHFEDEELEGTGRRDSDSNGKCTFIERLVKHCTAVPGRSRKQCRDRWIHYLDPAVNQTAWSEKEEMDLIRAHKIHGNKWRELAKIFPGRTGKAIKNHWTGAMKKKIKSYLGSRSPEQPLPCPNDPFIPVERNSTPTSSQDSSKNIQVSSDDRPVRPTYKQGLTVTEACRNACKLQEKGPDCIHDESLVLHSVNVSEMVDGQIVDEGHVLHSVNVSEMVDGQIVGSSMPIRAEEKMVSSLSSVDQKVAAANFPRSLKKKESTKFLEAPPGDFPAHSFQSSNIHSDVICSNADLESQELHLANIADLLGMSYCESLMGIAPDPTNDEDFMHGM